VKEANGKRGNRDRKTTRQDYTVLAGCYEKDDAYQKVERGKSSAASNGNLLTEELKAPPEKDAAILTGFKLFGI